MIGYNVFVRNAPAESMLCQTESLVQLTGKRQVLGTGSKSENSQLVITCIVYTSRMVAWTF